MIYMYLHVHQLTTEWFLYFARNYFYENKTLAKNFEFTVSISENELVLKEATKHQFPQKVLILWHKLMCRYIYGRFCNTFMKPMISWSFIDRSISKRLYRIEHYSRAIKILCVVASMAYDCVFDHCFVMSFLVTIIILRTRQLVALL